MNIDDIKKMLQEASEKMGSAQAGTSMSDEELSKAIAKIGADFDNPDTRNALASIVRERVFDTIRLYDMTAIVPNKIFRPGEIPTFYKRGRLRVYYLEEGADALTTQQTQDEFIASTRALVGAPSYNYDAFKEGRYDDMSEQTRLISEEFMGKKNKLVWDSIIASIPSTTGNGNYLRHSGTLTKTSLDKAINHVMEKNVNGVKCIIGLHKHMVAISEFSFGSSYNLNMWTEEQKRQYMNVGMIDMYRGCPIIALHQYIDGHGIPTIPDNEVLVLGADTDAFTFLEHGPFDTLEQLNASNRSWLVNMMIKIGFYVFKPEKSYRIKMGGY